MSKTFHVALREFNSTVLTKGFIVGLLLTPVIMLVAIAAVGLLANLEGPKVRGEVALVDLSGLAADGVAFNFSEEGLRAEHQRQADAINGRFDEAADAFGADSKQRDMVKGFSRSAIAKANGSGPHLTLRVLPPDADLQAEKAPVQAARVRSTKQPAAGAEAPPQRIALAVIPPGALRPGEDGKYERYTVYFADKLDFQIQQEICKRISSAIVDARVVNDPRAQAGNLAPADVRALLDTPGVDRQTVSETGEETRVNKISEITSFLIPVAFMLLLMMSVMTGGQYLLTTTIEEKSSRVMEVLLSAVSPMQLMVGKIVGQMAVGLMILVLYSGVGVASLLIFAQGHLLNPFNIVYLLIFFLIAFFLIASFMAAIGSAVTEMREAQTLMTPVMASMILPWLLVMPISRAPNATWATVLSFIPGLNPFVMMIRLAGSEPVPAWQIPATIAVGIISAIIAAWAAAKIFRVGILMYGKPPNFRTLWRWIRMA